MRGNLSRHMRGGRETGEYLKDVTRRGNSKHEPLRWNKLGTVRGAVSRQSVYQVDGSDHSQIMQGPWIAKGDLEAAERGGSHAQSFEAGSHPLRTMAWIFLAYLCG